MPAHLSVAILGFWHVHAHDYAASIQAHPDTVLAAVWDRDEERGNDAATELGVDFAPDLELLLSRTDIDAVVVTTATTEHHDVIARAIAAGKHVFTEKLLAPTVQQAEDLIAAAADEGVSLVVSLPRLSEGVTLAARRLIDDGSLGDLTYVRIRMAHDGWIRQWLPDRFGVRKDAVGGALSDLGCHPAYLMQAFLGPCPATLSASYTSTTGREVEDNAVVVASYPNGAIGVFEASFVTAPGAFAFEVRGTRGSLLFGFASEHLLAKGESFDPTSWTQIPADPPRASPFEQWVGHIGSGTQAHRNLDAALELTRIIATANQAATSHTVISYPTPTKDETHVS